MTRKTKWSLGFSAVLVIGLLMGTGCSNDPAPPEKLPITGSVEPPKDNASNRYGNAPQGGRPNR